MYLSKVILDANRRETMRALQALQMLHGAIERGFPGERARNLWRLDRIGQDVCLLVLSRDKPDFTDLVQQFGNADAEPPWESRDYDPLLERLEKGQLWRFRLAANPVRSSPSEKGKDGARGKVYAHVTVEQQKAWFLARSEANGFSLDPGFDVTSSRWLSFEKGWEPKRKVTVHMVVFEGVLRIEDAERFRQALTGGIGRAKAYGCGLLTIMRTENDAHG